MGASAAAAAIIAREKRIVGAFRSANATSPQSAVAPGDLGVTERVAFRKLREHGVLIEARAGAYYLDESKWAALSARRRKVALVMLVIVAVGLLASILFTFVMVH